MENAKTFKTRIINKHDVEENWLKATNFIPLAGEVIVYDSDNTCAYPRIKIGDGATLVSNLPFITDYNFTAEAQEKLNKTPLIYIGSEPPEEDIYDLWIDVDAEGNITTNITLATPEADGLMSAADKSKLDRMPLIYIGSEPPVEEDYDLWLDIDTENGAINIGTATATEDGLMSAEDKARFDKMPLIHIGTDEPDVQEYDLWIKTDEDGNVVTNIVNDLTTDDATKALSAAQGKALKDIADSKASGSATNVNLQVAFWVGSESYTNTVTVEGVTETNSIIVSPAPMSLGKYVEFGVYASEQSDGSITFAANEIPDVDLTINVSIINF